MSGKKKSLPDPQPTREEWQHLYAAAQAFKEAAPWETMTEEQIFGVRDPESGQVGYCSVTGLLGEHLALIVYEGEVGLGCYYAMINQHDRARGYLQEREAGFALLETPQLQASFEDRAELHSLDHEVIKMLGLRFRGRQAWPQFRYYQPGRHPWFVTAPQARFLALTLEQALIAIDEIDEAPGFLLAETEDAPVLLVRAQENGRWHSTWEAVEPVYPAYQLDVDEAPFVAARRDLPIKPVRMQVHLTMMGGGIEEDLPPYFPYLLLLVEANSGYVFGQDLMLARPSLDSSLAEIPTRFLAQLYAMRMRPEEVIVASERLYQLLAVPLSYMGIRLSRADSLPMLEDALISLEEWLTGTDT